MAKCFKEWRVYGHAYPTDLCLIGLAGDGFRKNTVLDDDWHTGDLAPEVVGVKMWIADKILFECMYTRLNSYLH